MNKPNVAENDTPDQQSPRPERFEQPPAEQPDDRTDSGTTSGKDGVLGLDDFSAIAGQLSTTNRDDGAARD